MFICPPDWFTVPNKKELTEQERELHCQLYCYLVSLRDLKTSITVADWENNQKLVEQLKLEKEQLEEQFRTFMNIYNAAFPE